MTWLEAHAPLAEITENLRAGAIDLWCPELALTHLVLVECGTMEADPGREGEGDTMAHSVLDAMEGLGRHIATAAAANRRSFRTDIPDSDLKRENDRSLHTRAVDRASALMIDLVDLHAVLMGDKPARGVE